MADKQMTDAEQLAAIKAILRKTFFDEQAVQILDQLIAIIETPEELARRARERPQAMSEERKADMEAALAELEYEIHLAIGQGVMEDKFQWAAIVMGPPRAEGEASEPWIALLTVGRPP